MSIELKIILSALAFIGMCFVAWLIATLRDGRRLRGKREAQELQRRQIEDAKREEMFSPTHIKARADERKRMEALRKEVGAPILDLSEDDDTTQILPPEGIH